MKQEIPVRQWRCVISPASCYAEKWVCQVRVADVEYIATARRLLAGDTNVNVGYLWHIDPASVKFADATTEA